MSPSEAGSDESRRNPEGDKEREDGGTRATLGSNFRTERAVW